MKRYGPIRFGYVVAVFFLVVAVTTSDVLSLVLAAGIAIATMGAEWYVTRRIAPPSKDDLGEVLTAWARGTALARRLRVSEMAGGVRIDVGEPGRSSEYVVTDVPDVLEPSIVEVRSTPEAQLLVVTKDAAATRVWLTDGGLAVAGERTLRQIDLREHPVHELPDGYKVEVSHAGGAIYATVSDEEGAKAASGRTSVFSGDAVADRIETDEAHRRRGLAAAVMSTLAAEARDAGATRGLVAAYDDGDALCEALGWETIAQVVVAAPRTRGA